MIRAPALYLYLDASGNLHAERASRAGARIKVGEGELSLHTLPPPLVAALLDQRY